MATHQATRPKRKGRTLHALTCVVCGVAFSHIDRTIRCCGLRCGRLEARRKQNIWRANKARERHARTCERCGRAFQMRRPSGKANAGKSNEGRFCSLECAGKLKFWASAKDRKSARKHMARAASNGSGVERFSRTDIFERDAWKCGLCGGRVNRRLRHPSPKSASLDHIVPLGRGGQHTRLNVQCAHLACNVAKRAMLIGQLRLFG